VQKLIVNILEGLAILLGPIFGAKISIAYGETAQLELYLTFLLSFLCWIATDRLCFIYLSTGQSSEGVGKKKDKTKKAPLSRSNFGIITSLIISAFFSLGILHLLQTKSEQFFFHLVLLALSLHSISSIANQRGLFWIWLITRGCYNSLVGALGFMVVTQQFYWQPFVISIGYSLMIGALHLSHFNFLGKISSTKHLVTIYSGLLFLGPVVISSLAVFRELPKNYIFILVVLFLAQRFPAIFKELLKLFSSKGAAPTDRRDKFVSANAGIIAALLLIVALLTTFS